MVENIINNWWIGLLGIIIFNVCGLLIKDFIHFCTTPNDKKLNLVKEWLLWAVADAEKELGSGTGKLKLRYVYDKFLSRFPYIAKVLPFIEFEALVNKALEELGKVTSESMEITQWVYPSSMETKDEEGEM